jgi:flagellar motility protein MotE (MotC chaperone)
MAEALKKQEQKPTGAKTEKQVTAVPQQAPKKTKGKKKGKAVAFIILGLLLAAAIAIVVLAAVKNLFGGRDMIISFITSLDPAYESLETREQALDEKELELSEKEEELASKEASLAEQAAELKSAQEAGENSSFEVIIAGLSEERVSQLKQLAEIYSGMDATLAAEAISELTGPNPWRSCSIIWRLHSRHR